MNNYRKFILVFIINAAIVAAIGAISIETRLAIEHAPRDHSSKSIKDVVDTFFFNLRIIPYKFAELFKLTSKSGNIPEWIKTIYTFILTFIIAILVYHLFLFILGYKKIYKYFFGNISLPIKVKTP